MLIKGTADNNEYRITQAKDYHQGNGTFIWQDGSCYKGEFYEGCIKGHGTFTWLDNSHYEGEWQDYVPHGRGVFTWPDGSQYEAEWEEGKPKERAEIKAEVQAIRPTEAQLVNKAVEKAITKTEERDFFLSRVTNRFYFSLYVPASKSTRNNYAVVLI